ncbi:hypothetical protein AB8O64_36590 (plasmid) [Streptomyces sp. QH1-20]|uniref:hypothetical protein n=1 Tax=Streptomyces sp. QH1-20 TaxID=3240934 RepID=UPI0035175E78
MSQGGIPEPNTSALPPAPRAVTTTRIIGYLVGAVTLAGAISVGFIPSRSYVGPVALLFALPMVVFVVLSFWFRANRRGVQRAANLCLAVYVLEGVVVLAGGTGSGLGAIAMGAVMGLLLNTDDAKAWFSYRSAPQRR